jgi:hypothetical protein
VTQEPARWWRAAIGDYGLSSTTFPAARPGGYTLPRQWPRIQIATNAMAQMAATFALKH